MRLSDLNEALIRRGAGSPQVFSRGEGYHSRGAVTALTSREGGMVLTAEVEGSEVEPYQVTVRFDRTRVEADCTCPYGEEWDGWCKHIVAVLLTALHEPEHVDEAPPLSSVLAGLDRERLVSVLERLVAADPLLADDIAEAVTEVGGRPAGGQRGPLTITPTGPAPVDAAGIERRVRRAARRLDDYGSDSYWHVGEVADEIADGPVRDALVRLEKGDARGALAVLEAVTRPYVKVLDEIDDSDGEASGVFYEIGAVWAEALLSADDLSAAERRTWAKKLEGWEADLDDYGISDALAAAIAAAREGWNAASLVRVLSGEARSLYAGAEERPYYADALLDARLNVLERRGRTEEALRLATAGDRVARAATLLAKSGRVAEAVRYASAAAETAAEALEAAQALEEADALDAALEVAAAGLEKPESRYGETASLAGWLREAAEAAGRVDLARRAAAVAVKQSISLANWLHAERLIGPAEWPPLRDDLLAHLRGLTDRTDWLSSGVTEVFLHEGQIDDALRSAQRGADPALLARVADAALPFHPDVVQSISRREAEAIMDAGKSGQYEEAAAWLRRMKAALAAAGCPDEWPPYRDALLETHRRKYKLVPLLKALG